MPILILLEPLKRLDSTKAFLDDDVVLTESVRMEIEGESKVLKTSLDAQLEITGKVPSPLLTPAMFILSLQKFSSQPMEAQHLLELSAQSFGE